MLILNLYSTVAIVGEQETFAYLDQLIK